MYVLKIFIYMSNYRVFCNEEKERTKSVIFNISTLTLKLLKTTTTTTKKKPF